MDCLKLSFALLLALGKLNRQGKQTVSQGERIQLTASVEGAPSSELNVGGLERKREADKKLLTEACST